MAVARVYHGCGMGIAGQIWGDRLNERDKLSDGNRAIYDAQRVIKLVGYFGKVHS